MGVGTTDTGNAKLVVAASVGSGDSGGSINPNAYGNVDYGINMGAMPYGYNAIQAGYKSFLNTSLSRTG